MKTLKYVNFDTTKNQRNFRAVMGSTTAQKMYHTPFSLEQMVIRYHEKTDRNFPPEAMTDANVIESIGDKRLPYDWEAEVASDAADDELRVLRDHPLHNLLCLRSCFPMADVHLYTAREMFPHRQLMIAQSDLHATVVDSEFTLIFDPI